MKKYKLVCAAALTLLALSTSQGVQAAEENLTQPESTIATDRLATTSQSDSQSNIELEANSYYDAGKIDYRIENGQRYQAQAEVYNPSQQEVELRFGVAHAGKPDHLIWEGQAKAAAGQVSSVQATGQANDSSNDTHLMVFNDSQQAIQLKPTRVEIKHQAYTEEEKESMRQALYDRLPAPSQDFRVLPYLQSPSSTSMSINWVSEFDTPGNVYVRQAGQEESRVVPASPVYMKLAEYTPAEIQQSLSFDNGNGHLQELEQGSWLQSNSNYKSEVDLVNLKPDTLYEYKVVQGDSTFEGRFKTFPSADHWESIRLIAFSDTETEPKGRLENREWELHTINPYQPGSEERPQLGSNYHQIYGHAKRNGQDLVRYPLSQFTALNENIAWIEKAQPHALIIAGDLTQGSGYQPAWDEFWRHFAGEESDLASQIPLISALGNWETYAAINGGYGNAALSRNKYHDYMNTPGDKANSQYKDSYYRTDIGPITILTLDSTKGIPTEIAGEKLTGQTYSGDDSILQEELWASGGLEADPYLTTDTQGSFSWEEYTELFETLYPEQSAEDVDLAGFNPGTAQWNWAIQQLEDARKQGQIILVQFHHAPYSSGVHGMAPNFAIPDNQSGVAMRVYTPLFEKYGVAAVIAGHDEMFERSFIDKNGDGIGFHVYDVGVAADGLRSEKMVQDDQGNYVPLNYNTHSSWSATADEAELWKTNEKGVKHLLDGGLHYGHLQMDLVRTDYGAYMLFQPVYIFPILNDDYRFSHTERRIYNDIVRVHFNQQGQVISAEQAAYSQAIYDLEKKINQLAGQAAKDQDFLENRQKELDELKDQLQKQKIDQANLTFRLDWLSQQIEELDKQVRASSRPKLAPSLRPEQAKRNNKAFQFNGVVRSFTDKKQSSLPVQPSALPQAGLASEALAFASASLLAGLGLIYKKNK